MSYTIEELKRHYKPEEIEIRANNRKLKLLSGKPHEVPTVKEFESVEVVGVFTKGGESGFCAKIGGFYCPLVFNTSEDYDGVLCAEYKTINGFLAWCGRQIG